MDEVPEYLSRWYHVSLLTEYTVIGIANLDADPERSDEYPVTIFYIGANGKLWSRPLHRWHGSMRRLS